MSTDNFGEVIKWGRKSRGLTLRELAKRIGISHPYLSQLENGRNDNPSIDIVLKLSKELDISFAYLIHISNVDIGLEKDLPNDILKALTNIRPSDFEGWSNYEEFKTVLKREGSLTLSDTDDEEAGKSSEEGLKKLYNYLNLLKKIENDVKANAILKEGLNSFENTTQSDFHEYRNKEQYNLGLPTPIYLNENNEGNFYFFKDGEVIPKETQEKLRLMIKTILD
ncbi:helix-turn-helix domain-containing protein [Ureibacillus composti]